MYSLVFDSEYLIFSDSDILCPGGASDIAEI